MPPTPSERKTWREDHNPNPQAPPIPVGLAVIDSSGRFCRACRHIYPCPTRRTLDALEAAEAVLRRLEEMPIGEDGCLCCPVCERGSPIVRRHGHYPGCALAAALAVAPPPGPPERENR